MFYKCNNFFYFAWSPIRLYGEGGFMTCTAASHQGAIKEPAASLLKMREAHPVFIMQGATWCKQTMLHTVSFMSHVIVIQTIQTYALHWLVHQLYASYIMFTC